MELLVVVIICILAFLIIKWYFKNHLKYKTETITSFTGGLGSGKTFLSVLKVKSIANRLRIKQWFRKVFGKPYREVNVYSNIPLYLGKKHGYAKVLKKEHLLLQEKLEGVPVILIDEIGAFANQFEFKNHNVINVFDEFIRFYRHYTQGGYIVCNDQCSENIILVVRRRLNKINNLSNFLKFGPFVFYYERMINISEEIKTIDVVDNKEENDTQNNMKLKFKLVFGIKKAYDTYCYSEKYDTVPTSEKVEVHQRLKTCEVLTCPKEKDFKYESLTRKKNKKKGEK